VGVSGDEDVEWLFASGCSLSSSPVALSPRLHSTLAASTEAGGVLHKEPSGVPTLLPCGPLSVSLASSRVTSVGFTKFRRLLVSAALQTSAPPAPTSSFGGVAPNTKRGLRSVAAAAPESCAVASTVATMSALAACKPYLAVSWLALLSQLLQLTVAAHAGLGGT